MLIDELVYPFNVGNRAHKPSPDLISLLVFKPDRPLAAG
jgi:hypothetical protein